MPDSRGEGGSGGWVGVGVGRRREGHRWRGQEWARRVGESGQEEVR